MAQTKTLRSSEVVEAMVEHLRKNLQLEDRTELFCREGMIFRGRGIAEKDMDRPFALEVMFDFDYTKKNSLRRKKVDERIKARCSGKLSERIYTGFIFPKSVDYAGAKAEFISPYFRSPNLLETIDAESEPELYERYKSFSYRNVKELSRPEWEIAITVAGSRVAYYNPMKKIVHVHELIKFPENTIIPDKRKQNEGYFWRYVMMGFFPQEGGSRSADTFRAIQEGLHDRVRRIRCTEQIAGKFTLTRFDGRGAAVVEYR